MSFLSLNNRIINYRLLGDAHKPLLMMAHPLGMNQAIWDELFANLLPHLRLLTWDLPGHGYSEGWPENTPLITQEDLAQEALALADAAGTQQFHFIGTSIGGVIGQQLLHHHAQRLLSVTLTNTGATIGTQEAWQLRANTILEKGLADQAASIVPRWFGPAICKQQTDLTTGWCHAMAQGDGRSYALLCEMLGRVNYANKPAQTEVPVLLIGGEDDIATTPSVLQALSLHLGITKAPTILKQVGHVPAIEDPKQLSKLLLQHTGNSDLM